MTALEIKSLVDRMTAMGVPEHPNLVWWGLVFGDAKYPHPSLCGWNISGNARRGSGELIYYVDDSVSISDEDAEAIYESHYWRHIQKESPNVIPIGGLRGAVEYMEGLR